MTQFNFTRRFHTLIRVINGSMSLITIVLVGIGVLLAWFSVPKQKRILETLSNHDHQEKVGSFADVVSPGDTITLFTQLAMDEKELRQEMRIPDEEKIQRNICHFAQPNEKCDRLKIFIVTQKKNDNFIVQGALIAKPDEFEFTRGDVFEYEAIKNGTTLYSVLLRFERNESEIALVVSQGAEMSNPNKLEDHYRELLYTIGETNFILGGAMYTPLTLWPKLIPEAKISPWYTPSDANSNYVMFRGLKIVTDASVKDADTIVGLQFE